MELNRMRPERLKKGSGHFFIEGRQHLVLQFDDGCGDAAPHKIFDELQSDKAAADNDRLRHAAPERLDDGVHVLHIAEREDARQVDSRQRRPQRGGARRQDQFVVRLLVLLAGSQVPNSNCFSSAVD